LKLQRWSLVGLLTTALLVPGVAACGPEDGKPSAAGSTATTIPADPKQALLASTKEIAKGHFRFAMTADEVTSDGVVHLPSQSARMSMKMGGGDGFGMEMDLIYIEPDSWVKVKIEGLPGGQKANSDKYQHLDQSKVKEIDEFQFKADEADPASVDKLFKVLVDVQKAGEGVYRGTLDLTKVGELDSLLADSELAKSLGVEAAKLPFEATLDAQGRLTTLMIDIPAAGDIKAHQAKITYSEYGTAAPPEKPAPADVVEASDEFYDMFKSSGYGDHPGTQQ
jgi:hypothetical protein